MEINRSLEKWYRIAMAFALATWLILSLTGCVPNVAPRNNSSSEAGPAGGAAGQAADGSRLLVHFIDVGQGDSILIESAGHFMLIDAGENDQGETVVSYLEAAGVTKLDYVIGTHPHSDHIGGLDDVINAFDSERVILPPVEHTTRTYEDVLDAAADKGLKLTKPKPGTSYTLGKAEFTIIAPVKDYGDNLNNWSVGLRLTCGDTAFVMCGDTEAGAEQDIIDSGAILSADVLKTGHHGSSTSTSDTFFKAVSPEWAVIQCGKDNSYGHPHKETLEKFQKAGVHVLRNDELGTIIAVSNGTSISWFYGEGTQALAKARASSQNGQDNQRSPAQQSTYILNKNTKKFHLPDCSSVKQIQESNKEEYTGDRSQLIKDGYAPCRQCKP